jgi:hypothetical protein
MHSNRTWVPCQELLNGISMVKCMYSQIMKYTSINVRNASSKINFNARILCVYIYCWFVVEFTFIFVKIKILK